MSLVLGQEWHISKNGYDMLNQNRSITFEQLLKLALDTDIKEICSPVLSTELSKERTSKIVLQIQKIRNISAPKANEESQAAPRILKFSLTDGDTYVQAIELSPLISISRNTTPPGTKILINNARVSSGYLLLTPDNCTLLGGRVPALIEKWEVAKSIKDSQRRNSNNDGPPKWVNFGSKLQTDIEDNFKSLGAKSKESSKEKSDFELQRQGAIAEATSGATKKVFGGRVTQNIQAARNNPRYEKREVTKNKTKPSFREKEIDEKPEKPQEKVSLFSFLEDKLPLDDHKVNIKETVPREHKNQIKTSENSIKPQLPVDKSAKILSYNSFSRFTDNNLPKQNHYQKNVSQKSNYHSNDKYTNSTPQDKIQEKNRIQKQNSLDYVQNSSERSNLNLSNKTTQQTASQNDTKNIEEAATLMAKMSINSEFATRSLRQHLSLVAPKQNKHNNTPNGIPSRWKIGDGCLAKYWEDGKFYDAEIVAITDKTIVVKFFGYGNIEEVLCSDCLPLSQRNPKPTQLNRRNDRNSASYSGSMEFRRSSRNFH